MLSKFCLLNRVGLLTPFFPLQLLKKREKIWLKDIAFHKNRIYLICRLVVWWLYSVCIYCSWSLNVASKVKKIVFAKFNSRIPECSSGEMYMPGSIIAFFICLTSHLL